MIIHMDNWSLYGGVVANMLDGVFAEVAAPGSGGVALVADPDGISPGWVLRFPGATSTAQARFVLPDGETDTVGIAHRLWMETLPTNAASNPGCYWRTDSNATIATLWVNPTGRIIVSAGAGTGGAILGESDIPVVTASGWYHIEAKLVVDPVNGSIEVRVEGIPVILEENINTGAVLCAQVGLCTSANGSAGSIDFYRKDFIVWTGEGTENTDFLGACIVYDLVLTSDVDLNWTPSTGVDGFSILDNSPPNDAQFITAPNPPPLPYVGAHAPLPPDVTSVKGIMTMVRAAKSDGGDASLQMGIISDPAGTPATVLGADRPITVAQTYWRDVFETDPATAAPWLPSAVDECEMQIDRTT